MYKPTLLTALVLGLPGLAIVAGRRRR